MCTLGSIYGTHLFKTRDLWSDSDSSEEIVHGRGRYRYVGVQGHATPLERGFNSGINELGVAVAITFADTIPLAEALSSKTPRGVLVEEILRSCGSLSDALRLVAEFLTTPLVGGNIVIATPDGGVVIEQLYPHWAIEQIIEPVTVRTNHFCNLRMKRSTLGNETSSSERYERLQNLLGNGSGITVDKIKQSLADHHGTYPICSHNGELHTISAVIYDLETAALHYTQGQPCEAQWRHYRAY